MNLSPYESRVLWFVLRKTYGHQKKADRIPLSQFSKGLYLDRRLVHRAIKSLESKHLLVIGRDDSDGLSYGLQKDYTKWRASSRKMTVISRDDKTSSPEMTRVSSVEIPSKERRKEKRKRVTDEPSPHPSLSTSSKRKPTRLDPAAQEAFRQFYQAFPRHVARQEAQRAWLKLSPDAELIKVIMTGVRRYAEDVKDAEPKYIKHPGPWLNGRRWEDETDGADGTDHEPVVKELGDGWLEVDGKRMTAATYKVRYGQEPTA